jgi:hypothetical protein
VLIDPAATDGDPAANDLNRFYVLVSTTGHQKADFHRVLSARCKKVNRLQKFSFQKRTLARYVELVARTNHGGLRMAVDEFEVYGSPAANKAFSDDVVAAGPAVKTTASTPRAARSRSKSNHLTATKSSPLASVRAIILGLTELPPHQKKRPGRVKDSLQSQYGLLTQQRQRAAVGFRDGTTLAIAPQTSLVLRDPHITSVTAGKVVEVVAPGSDHRLQSPAAVASAVGTRFVIIVHGKHTMVVVIEGAVRVRTKHASVLVKTGQETTIVNGHKPTKPVKDPSLKSQTGFTTGLPMPPLPENIALDYNGGKIISGPPL